MTDPLCLTIDPLDTLMFRDGRPFNQADAGASEATSVFPPYPPTMVGAIRAALWRFLGRWDAERLGNGTDWQDPQTTLGPLVFGAPLVLYDGAPAFPTPLHLVSGEDESLTQLLPGRPMETDLGKVRLPGPREEIEGLKALNDRWLTAHGLEVVLAGDLPQRDEWVDKDFIWRHESRVGIGIDRESRRTDRVQGSGGQLYMASHIRPSETTKLYITLRGWQGDHPFSQDEAKPVPLAGEHRMACISLAESPLALPPPPGALGKSSGKTLYFAYLVSPCVLDDLAEAVRDLKGEVVSACLGKEQMIGGWDSENRKPVPLRPALPAGSVWFMQSDRPEEEILALHGTHIGVAGNWGFGQVLIGAWQER